MVSIFNVSFTSRPSPKIKLKIYFKKYNFQVSIYPLYLIKTKITERDVHKFESLLHERKGMKLLSYMSQRIDINQTQHRTCS